MPLLLLFLGVGGATGSASVSPSRSVSPSSSVSPSASRSVSPSSSVSPSTSRSVSPSSSVSPSASRSASPSSSVSPSVSRSASRSASRSVSPSSSVSVSASPSSPPAPIVHSVECGSSDPSFGRKWYEFTEYETPDGSRYRFENHERFLLSQTGYGMPQIKYITQRGPMQQGETIYDYRLEPRVIQMVIRNKSASRQGYWNIRAALMNYLRPNRQTLSTFKLGRLTRTLRDGSKRSIDVIIEDGPRFEETNTSWDMRGTQDTIRFIAPDPTFYDPNIKTQAWVLNPDTSGYLVLPFSFDGNNMRFGMSLLYDTVAIVYDGTYMSFPNIVITGPINYPVIENITTNEQIALNYIIDDGEQVTIALPFGNKTVTSSTLGNIIGVVKTVSDLSTFHIAPSPEATGGINNFVGYGTGANLNTAITMTYYTRYIGI